MTREQLEEMAAEYAKINNNIFSNSTEERIKLGFIKGYEKAQEQLKNCGNSTPEFAYIGTT